VTSRTVDSKEAELKIKQIVFFPSWLFVRAYREYPILSVTFGLIFFFYCAEAIKRTSEWLTATSALPTFVVGIITSALVLFFLLPGIIAVWVFGHQFFGAFLRLFVRKPSWTPQKTIIDVVEWVLK
jgi:hypothetical protein